MKGCFMNSRFTGLIVACIVFGLVSLLQLMRVLAGAEIMLDGHLVPLWGSGIAFLVAGALSAWMGWLSYRGMN